MKHYLRNLLIIVLTICIGGINYVQGKTINYYTISEVNSENIEQFVSNLTNEEVHVDYLLQLYDIQLEPNYLMAVFKEGGHIIFSNYGLNLSECVLSKNNTNPYIDYEADFCIYAGPENYYALSNDDYELSNNDYFYGINTKNGNFEKVKITTELLDVNNRVVHPINNNNLLASVNWIGCSYSNFSHYINDSTWANISPGYCGPISASLMLAYYQNFIPSYVSFNSTTVRNGSQYSAGNMISLMINRTPQPTATTPYDVRDGVSQFMLDYNLSSTLLFPETSVSTWTKAVSKLNSTKKEPVCVGTLTTTSSTYGNHWFTAFQYATINGTNVYRCYNCNTKNLAQVNVSWTVGLVYMTVR